MHNRFPTYVIPGEKNIFAIITVGIFLEAKKECYLLIPYRCVCAVYVCVFVCVGVCMCMCVCVQDL